MGIYQTNPTYVAPTGLNILVERVPRASLRCALGYLIVVPSGLGEGQMWEITKRTHPVWIEDFRFEISDRAGRRSQTAAAAERTQPDFCSLRLLLFKLRNLPNEPTSRRAGSKFRVKVQSSGISDIRVIRGQMKITKRSHLLRC
jgi:hypothetical protein